MAIHSNKLLAIHGNHLLLVLITIHSEILEALLWINLILLVLVHTGSYDFSLRALIESMMHRAQ